MTAKRPRCPVTYTLHHGDCLEVMAGMEAGSVDAVVTDPPYGIGFDYGEGRSDVACDAVSYGVWTRDWFGEAWRLLRDGGFFACWQTQLYFRHFWDWFGDDIHIYPSCKNFAQLRPTPINFAYDPVVMMYKGDASLRPEGRGGPRDWHIANTAAPRDDYAKQHPCPRTVDAVRSIVAGFTLPGGTILDPFMGSGTTGVACIEEGRDFIGIEKEAEYVEIARRRIEAAAAQERLPV
jgi:site-specific DNA-methyltransferase (adenine-specific)